MKVKVKTTPLGDVFSCRCCAPTGPLGVSVATSNLAPASIFTILLTIYLFFFTFFLLLSPSRAHLGVPPSGPSRLVFRVVGCPRPQALIGIEVHGIHFLPAYFLQSNSRLRRSRNKIKPSKKRPQSLVSNHTLQNIEKTPQIEHQGRMGTVDIKLG